MYSFDPSTFNVPAGLVAAESLRRRADRHGLLQPAARLPAPDCSATQLTCEQNENGTNVCTAKVTVSQSQMMNLGQEVSQLHSFTGLVTIKIKRITTRSPRTPSTSTSPT